MQLHQVPSALRHHVHPCSTGSDPIPWPAATAATVNTFPAMPANRARTASRACYGTVAVALRVPAHRESCDRGPPPAWRPQRILFTCASQRRNTSAPLSKDQAEDAKDGWTVTGSEPPQPPPRTDGDDCPACGADLAVHRILYAGLLLLCDHCGTDAPPAPASAWGPALPGTATNWSTWSRPGTRLAVRRRPLPQPTTPTD